MALEKFKLYNDSDMTDPHVPASGDKLSFNTDGTTTLYLGATVSGWELQANGGGNIVVTPTQAVAVWQAITAYALNDEARTVSKLGYYFKCTTAGTSGATEPSWATASTTGDTIVDGTVTWTNIGKLHETTEVKLALTEAGLATAVAGDPLTITAPLASGASQAIWIKLTDGTGGGVASTNLSINTNELEEYQA